VGIQTNQRFRAIYLGIPLHPLYQSLTPILDRFSSQISQDHATVVVSPPYIIPSSKFKDSKYPLSLCQHLLTLSPRRDSLTPKADDLPRNSQPEFFSTVNAEGKQSKEPSTSRTHVPRRGSMKFVTEKMKPNGTFLGMPTMHMNIDLNMDVRKWSWPGFGKPGKKTPPALDQVKKVKSPEIQDTMNFRGNASEGTMRPRVDVSGDVDANSLAEAIDSDDIRDSKSQTPVEEAPPAECDMSSDVPNAPPNAPPNELDAHLEPLSTNRETIADGLLKLDTPDNELSPELEFSTTVVHLAGDEPLATRRRKVFYTTASGTMHALMDDHNRTNIQKYDFTLALVGFEDHEDDLQSYSQAIIEVFEGLQTANLKTKQE
jgi:hypothetical protein